MDVKKRQLQPTLRNDGHSSQVFFVFLKRENKKEEKKEEIFPQKQSQRVPNTCDQSINNLLITNIRLDLVLLLHACEKSCRRGCD